MRSGARAAVPTRPGSPEDDRAAIERIPSSVGMNQGMQVLSYLISGIALYGLLGWLGDQLLGTSVLLPVGIVLGAGLGIYVVIRRFGQVGLTRTGNNTSKTGPGTTGTKTTEGTT